MNQKDLRGRLAWWSRKLQQFDFVIEHRKGCLNVVPGTLSRFDIDALAKDCCLPEIDICSPEFYSDEYNNLGGKYPRKSQHSIGFVFLSDNFVHKRVKFRNSDDEEQNLWRL